MITAEQIRAARALVRIEQKRLAKAAGVSLSTVQRLELQRGPLKGSYQTITKLQAALESRGVVFTKRGVELDRETWGREGGGPPEEEKKPGPAPEE